MFFIYLRIRSEYSGFTQLNSLLTCWISDLLDFMILNGKSQLDEFLVFQISNCLKLYI